MSEEMQTIGVRIELSLSYMDTASERHRAHNKHRANGNSMETKRYTDPMWLPVLVEEVGEVARVLCDGEGPLRLREELVQVMAMASAWIDAIDSPWHG